MTKQAEIWKDCVNGFSRYEVSSLGRLRNKKKDFILKLTVDSSTGYQVVNVLGDDGRRRVKCVHRFVAEAFIPNPEGKRVVNHINCIKTDNRVENLEWASDSENMKHAFQNGLCENTRNAAYEQVKRLQAMPKTERQREVARENIIKINKRPKTERQLEVARSNINSSICRERAVESHINRHPPIRLMETGEVYRSQRELANVLGISESTICACLKGRREHAEGYHFEYVNNENDSKDKTPSVLYDFQMDAVKRAQIGSIFNGGTGTGKSRTGLYFYFKEQGGSFIGSDYVPMKNPKDLYIISTAAKRDKGEWSEELALFRMSTDPELNYYKNKIVVDSWNNIKKYTDLEGAFVVFDEDKACGSGVWAKSFIKIAKKNDWIMLSATAGDQWTDYWAVFVANGFYKNKTEFQREHIVYSRYCTSYPRIERYINTDRLLRQKDMLLIDMNVMRHTKPHHEDVYCDYDIVFYKDTLRRRWNPFTDEPTKQASELCYVLRKIVNSHESRQVRLLEILEDHPRAIIFYSYDYERDILLSLGYGDDVVIAEWNGHKHEPVPNTEKWVYLCNYGSAAEGINVITTNTIIFFSQTYSYKTLTQAVGRVDRLNTPYTDLYYYHLKSRSGIDLAISKALKQKKKFNEARWADSWKF